MAMLLVIWLTFGPLAGLLLVPLVILIVAVRLYLKRHTLAQVVGGLLLGSAVVLGPAWLGLFPT
jgi:membrane-associated phospholipid phosphatase